MKSISQPSFKKKISKPNIPDEHFSNYIKMEWKKGKRFPISIRINDKLYAEFKTVSKQLYGSTCRAVENYMAAVVLSARQKVHFSNTQQPIQIGKIVIERNLKPRRSLPKQEFEGNEQSPQIQKNKPVILKNTFPDYSKFSTEKLERMHEAAKNMGNMGKSALIFMELKKRKNI